MVDLGLIHVLLCCNGNTGQNHPRAAWSQNSGHRVEAWENEVLTEEERWSGRGEHMGRGRIERGMDSQQC